MRGVGGGGGGFKQTTMATAGKVKVKSFLDTVFPSGLKIFNLI